VTVFPFSVVPPGAGMLPGSSTLPASSRVGSIRLLPEVSFLSVKPPISPVIPVLLGRLMPVSIPVSVFVSVVVDVLVEVAVTPLFLWRSERERLTPVVPMRSCVIIVD